MVETYSGCNLLFFIEMLEICEILRNWQENITKQIKTFRVDE